MSETSRIGLDQQKSQELAEGLNDLLANLQLFYQNTRGFHWNIKGEKFFELHAKFEELYNDLLIKVDEVAERILTLGYTPDHTFSNYVQKSEIKEISNASDANVTVEGVLSGLKVLVSKERKLLDLSGEADDEGTNALMSDYIREQEKLIWMYSAFQG
ncbi:MAG: Dps family protein [Bacteroidota bacterium]